MRRPLPLIPILGLMVAVKGFVIAWASWKSELPPKFVIVTFACALWVLAGSVYLWKTRTKRPPG